MHNDSNVALLPLHELKDKDGNGEDATPIQVIIDSTMNGFVLNVHGSEEDLCKCYIFTDKGENGPKAMIQEIIDHLGLADKVKLEK